MRKGGFVAVRIRMKMMGRKHRHYFRIVAIDSRQPRDGRIIEELGSYDPTIADTDARVQLKPDRVKYWMGVGAKPSEKVAVLFKKYMGKFEEQAAQPPTLAAEAPPPNA
jgi:small subunit ribosomal protein S16